MKVETKYNVGDSLFILHEGKIIVREVESIEVKAEKDKQSIRVWFRNPKETSIGGWEYVTKNEAECFLSKAELIESLD